VKRLVLAAIVGVVLAVAWAAASATPGRAHASLKESDPENGALLDQAPAEIRLTFTEPPDLELTTIGVVDRAGADVPTGPVERVAGDEKVIRVVLVDLPDGVYTVTWRTVSATDGHFTSGAFTFGVGVSTGEVVPIAPEAATRTPAPTGLAVAGRWSLYVGLAILLGAAVAGLFVFGTGTVARPRVLAPAWGLAAMGVLLMTFEERRVVGVSLGTLLRSDAGDAYIRLAVAVAIVGVATLAVCLGPSTTKLVVLAAAAVGAIWVRAAGGHAGPSLAEITLQSAHFAAAGAWIGGLVWLVLGVRRGADGHRVRAYSRVAAIGLGVLALTGILRASNELGGLTWWLHAFDTDYGTALVIKLAIVVPLIALGALNRFRNTRRYEELGPRPLLRTVSGELALAAGVFAMTGILTGLPPQEPRTPQAPTESEPLVVIGSDFATTTRVRLEVSPGTVGANAFVAEVTDFDTGEPVDARRVTLTFSLPGRPEVGSELELKPGRDATWRADGTALALDGTWNVTVLIEQSAGSREVPLTLTPRPPDQRVQVSRVEGQPDIYTITLSGGVSIQAYVDPGLAGRPNQVHVTAFDATGQELPLAEERLVITPPDGEPFEPELLLLTPGHFVANVEVETGTSSFRIEARTPDGDQLAATFEQTFED
jgi:copper transport protein